MDDVSAESYFEAQNWPRKLEVKNRLIDRDTEERICDCIHEFGDIRSYCIVYSHTLSAILSPRYVGRSIKRGVTYFPHTSQWWQSALPKLEIQVCHNVQLWLSVDATY